MALLCLGCAGSSFSGRSDFLAQYRALHRFLLQEELAGFSHADLARRFPGSEAHELKRVFENVYYAPDPPDPEWDRAAALCRSVLESHKPARQPSRKP